MAVNFSYEAIVALSGFYQEAKASIDNSLLKVRDITETLTDGSIIRGKANEDDKTAEKVRMFAEKIQEQVELVSKRLNQTMIIIDKKMAANNVIVTNSVDASTNALGVLNTVLEKATAEKAAGKN